MKRSKLPQQLAKNASKLHIHTGNLLVQLFPGYEIRQEYPVNKVNCGFNSGRESAGMGSTGEFGGWNDEDLPVD